MYVRGLLKEDRRTCHLTARNLEEQLLRLAFAFVSCSRFGDMCGRLLLAPSVTTCTIVHVFWRCFSRPAVIVEHLSH